MAKTDFDLDGSLLIFSFCFEALSFLFFVFATESLNLIKGSNETCLAFPTKLRTIEVCSEVPFTVKTSDI